MLGRPREQAEGKVHHDSGNGGRRRVVASCWRAQGRRGGGL
jgi:hypothetical protein